jgi:hypothetical protein
MAEQQFKMEVPAKIKQFAKKQSIRPKGASTLSLKLHTNRSAWFRVQLRTCH